MAAALLQAGFAGSPSAAARTLLGALIGRGFAAGAKGGLEQKLGQALTQFQSQNGLPVTGRLDAATINLLSKLGLVPRGEIPQQQAQQSLGLQRSRDGFEGKADAGKKEQATGGESAPKVAPQVAQQNAQTLLKAPKRAFDFALSKLGLGGGATAQEGGASQTPADANAPPPQALSEGAVAQGRADGTGMSRAKQSGDSRASGKDEVRAKQGAKDNLDRGAEDGDDDEGREGGDEAAGREGGEEGGANEEGAWDTGAADGDGSEHNQGNATSGDDDWRKKAGHAQSGDEDADIGHYEIPSVAEQVRVSLKEIYVDIAAGAAKATTYTWEVELYRPGVYGPGQKAENVFKLRVERATAFDRVWAKAADRLNQFQKVLDEAEDPVEPEDVLAAIRQARFRRD
jgi:hypothetical protein